MTLPPKISLLSPPSPFSPPFSPWNCCYGLLLLPFALAPHPPHHSTFHAAASFGKTSWVLSLFKTYFNVAHLKTTSLVWAVHRMEFFTWPLSASVHLSPPTPAQFALYFSNGKLQARWAIPHLHASAHSFTCSRLTSAGTSAADETAQAKA